MFNETSYSGLGATREEMRQYSKAERKQIKQSARAAGISPLEVIASRPITVTAPPLQAPPDYKPLPMPKLPEGSHPAADSQAGGGIGDFFKNIPTTYLVVGGCVAAFLLLKKR